MIKSVKIDGKTYVEDNSYSFEEFELSGEYCMIQWIRIKDHVRNCTLEFPLNKVEWIVKV